MSQVQIEFEFPIKKHLATRTRLLRVKNKCIRFISMQKIVVISALFILLIISFAILAPVIAPYDPVAQHREAFLSAPTMQHLMGTDDLGRDVFSRIIYGARISLLVGFATIIISIILGTIIGMISGFFGGIVDMVI